MIRRWVLSLNKSHSGIQNSKRESMKDDETIDAEFKVVSKD